MVSHNPVLCVEIDAEQHRTRSQRRSMNAPEQVADGATTLPRPISVHHASAVPKMRVNGRGEDVIFFDGVFFKSSLKSIFFVS